MTATTYLKNTQITLRAPEPEDLEVMYQIENDTQLWAVGNATVPFSRFVLRQYIETSTQDIFADKQARFMIVQNSNQAVVGIIDLTAFDVLNNRAEVCVVILSSYRRNSFAKQSVELLCDYCALRLHIHQLYAYVPVDNVESRSLFAYCGFTQTAQLSQWLNGEHGFIDAVLLQRILG